jgi:hypothetical protein
MAGFLMLPRPVSAALSADPNAEIIYIDDNGVIRVLDTQGDPLVQWVSPNAGWEQIVLLDVSHDGDLEILALDILGETSLVVTVFDPVLAQGSMDPNKQINGIPWDELWTTTIEGEGEYIVAGDFDANIPGDEFAVGFRHGDTSLVQIYNANSLGTDGRPTGRDWKVHIQKEYPNIEYTYGVSGQLNGEGAEELILFDPESDTTRMDTYRPDQDMFLTDEEYSSNDRFKYGATGKLEEDGNDWLVAILTVSDADRTSLRTYEMASDGELEEDLRLAFAPQPDWVFLADIRGNGDKEVLFLRNYPEGQEGPRLIMRDDWGDDQGQNEDLIEWALMDDGADNEFRAGAGGDVDGDGRDEIILLRDDRIRVYHRPENGDEGSSNYNDYMRNTDNERINLLAGDLDRNGFVTGPILIVTYDLLDATVPAGTTSRQFIVQATNTGTDGSIPVNAIIPSGARSWAKVEPVRASTPATFRVTLDATALEPGEYRTTMTLSAEGSNVLFNDFVIGIRLAVVPPIIEPNPPILSMYRFPCEDDPCSDEEIAERNEPFTATIALDGSTDLAFRAAILGVPPQGGDAATTAGVAGLPGAIARGVIENGNIVLYDTLGNSRTLGSDLVSAAATHTTTIMLDPLLTWITTATVESDIIPTDISLGIDPSILGEDFQREHAVLILVADTRAGSPNGNVTLVPIQLANIGQILWSPIIANE